MKPDYREIFQLIGTRYLDIQHSEDEIQLLEAKLRKTGVTGLRRFIFEYIAASALWWNIFSGEWVLLGLNDVKAGWKLNTVLFGGTGILCAFLFTLKGGILCSLGLHILTLGLGIAVRQGTRETKEK